MSRTTNKHCALVTGGARRIGRAICLKLSSMGYTIAIQFHNSKTAAEELKAEIQQSGGEAGLFSCNLTDPTNTRKLIPLVLEHYPNLSVLVNNASVFEKDSLREADLALFEQHFKIHGQAPFILSHMFARHCKEGDIINLLDTHITQNQSQHFSYLLSKKMLLAMTEMAAVELAPGIRVNGIAPGLILPPDEKSEHYLRRLAKDIPLKRKGSLENVTRTVEFLLKNDFLTGQVIFNDGGEHLL
ncbi:MAG: SDR family oxidoreductase [Candidatus Omnitrophica bacterium]|nr:SDR family oxidoreductase [Candidatus Omnitrophota bacterium]